MPRGDGKGPRRDGRGDGTGKGRRGERCGSAGGGSRGGGRRGGRCWGEELAEKRSTASRERALPAASETDSKDTDDQRVTVATSARIGLMASINEDLCALCGICQAVCPTGAISTDDKPVIDPAKCSGCGDCVTACPSDAIVLVKAAPTH